MDYLRQLLLAEAGVGRLDRAALDLARIQFPNLEHEPWLDQINEIAASLGDRLRNFNDGRDFVETAQRYLFGELGFQPNEQDFFDPCNSCLNEVLDRRTGRDERCTVGDWQVWTLCAVSPDGRRLIARRRRTRCV